MKTIPAEEIGEKFDASLDTARREPILITERDQPVAVLMSIEEAQNLLDDKVRDGIAKGLADVEAGRHTELTAEHGDALKTRFKAEIV